MSFLDIMTALVAAAVLIAVVGVRTYTDGKIEVRLNDAIIAVIAAALMLFMTGRISKFALGSSGLTVESTREVILSASAQSISQQVAALPVVAVLMEEKSAVDEIPRMVERQIPALDFVLGSNSYAPEATREYLNQLTNFPFFRFVFILKPDKSVFGAVEARKLRAFLNDPNSGMSFANFTDIVNRGSQEDQARIEKLPNFVPASAAVKRTTDKRDALQRMESLGVDWLPVVNQEGQFEGIVERSRLTASLILDVANQLKATPPAQ